MMVPQVVGSGKLAAASKNCACFLFAAGFEERALKVFRVASPMFPASRIVILRYAGATIENDRAFSEATSTLSEVGRSFDVVLIDLDKPAALEDSLRQALMSLELVMDGEIWLDVSGLPLWGIALTLKVLREKFPLRRLVVLYTEAKEYFPTRSEYMKSAVRNKAQKLQVRLPESLTSEMAESLILECFAGAALYQHSTALLLFAGYEKHRSIGVIEQINPSKLVLIYGTPGLRVLQWRLELSKNLHAALVTDRPTAEETVSTLRPGETITVLDRYYSMLYDDHNVVVAPVCSKMQGIGCFLFWERYRDVQMVFPLPVRYLPERFSRGVGRSFMMDLPLPPGFALLGERG